MTTSFEFPQAVQDDPSDVATAIETAKALWRRGDLHESLRWVRRAAEAAETDGNDLRALSLARAAADLQEQFRVSPPSPQSSAGGSSARASSIPPSRSAPPPRSAPPTSARASAPPARAGADFAASLNVPLAPKLEPWVSPAERAATESARPAMKPEPKFAEPPSFEHPTPSVEPVAPRLEMATPVVATLPPAERRAPLPSDPRTAVRVSVVAGETPGSFAVTLLGDGERPANGGFEALLVPLARGVDPRDLAG